MAPVAAGVRVPFHKALIHGFGISLKAHRHRIGAVLFHELLDAGQGYIFKIVVQDHGYTLSQQRVRLVVHKVHGGNSQLHLFVAAAKAHIVKEDLLDGILGNHRIAQLAA